MGLMVPPTLRRRQPGPAGQRQKLGLTPAELQVIADNVAPYLPRLQK